MAQNDTNFSGNPGANQPTDWVSADGFTGPPAQPFNPNSPTFQPAQFPSGMGLQAGSGAAPTIASATTIAPTTPVVFISGTAAIATITPPPPLSTTGGQIVLVPTGIFTTTTAGNIALASTAVVSKALFMTYDPTTTKWYPSY